LHNIQLKMEMGKACGKQGEEESCAQCYGGKT